MKKRNLFAVFVFSIITFGIYDLVWLVKIKRELNSKTRIHVPTIWLLFVPLILIFVSLIAVIVVAVHNAANGTVSGNSQFYSYNANGTTTVTTTTTSNGSGAGILVLLYILSFIAWFGLSFYWFFKFSKAVNEYTNGKMSTGVSFLLLWLLHLIGVLLIQDTFNDMLDAGTIPGAAAPPSGGVAPVQPTNASPQPVVTGEPMQAAPAPMQPAAPAPAAPQPMNDVAPAPASPQQTMPAPTTITPTQAPDQNNSGTGPAPVA